MNIKAYIESGILEQHVLGMATPQESAEVIRYAMEYPEIQKEIDGIEETLLQFGQNQAIDPPAELKAKIMTQLDAKVYNLPNDQNMRSKNGSLGMSRWELLGMILALIFAASTYYFSSKNNAQISENVELQSKYNELEEQCAKNRNGKAILIKHLAVLKDLDTKPVLMEGTPLSPESNATVYWNDHKQSSYLDIASLPAPSKDMQYQLWAIVDGKPVDMGVFDLDQDVNSLKEVPFIENPQAFAVTLEPIGGVESPTMDQMYVLGKI